LKALAAQPLDGFGLSRWIEWGVCENNRQARYYALTTRGRQMRRPETATWKRYVAAVSGVLETA
jgi:hypothetical protein